jgi:hypothetical protein
MINVEPVRLSRNILLLVVLEVARGWREETREGPTFASTTQGHLLIMPIVVAKSPRRFYDAQGHPFSSLQINTFSTACERVSVYLTIPEPIGTVCLDEHHTGCYEWDSILILRRHRGGNSPPPPRQFFNATFTSTILNRARTLLM